ncbi:quinone oxidoreductase family protein [Natronorubrum sp. FCH18a]|uniref:quinone oxidoreductase family protein n=1 Tax=Natronorubrum sp. FCH18a TaxID=3447018 RepID=UPI003F50E161
MRVVQVPAHGPADVLELTETETPAPESGEVRIRNAAIGVNFADVKRRSGSSSTSPPYVPGLEAAGTIDAVGDGAAFEVGDRVVACVDDGAYAEATIADAESVFRIPDALSFEEAAGSFVQFVTAHNCLHEWGGFEANERVLVHGAAGGVGSAAVQLAADDGAEIFATASTDEKLEFVSELGADHPINYVETDFAAAITELTDGSGVDLVLDGVGGQTFDESLDVLANFGRIVSIGSASGSEGEPDLRSMRLRNVSVVGYHLPRALETGRDRVLPAIDDVFSRIVAGDIEVVIDDAFPLEEAAAAHEYIENRNTRGKLLLRP